MMTTEPDRGPRGRTDAPAAPRAPAAVPTGPGGPSGTGVLVGAAAATIVAGLLLGLVALLLDGTPAAAGALVGAVVVAVVLLLGTVPMNLVAAVMPGLSLAFALLTYLFQLVVLIGCLVALDQAGLVGDELSRGWLGGAVMAGVVCWTVTHVVLASRARIPIYSLPSDAGER
jgi:ATP synthase protein I